MIGEIVVLTPEEYRQWTAGSTSGMSLAQNGERLFASLGCNACHNGSPDARGPNLAQVYGAKLQLASGSYVLVDEAFLRDSDPESFACTSRPGMRRSCRPIRGRSAKKA